MPKPVSTSIISQALSMPPEDAIRFLKAKGLEITWDWQEQLRINTAQVFTVAKVAKLSVLQETRDLLAKALNYGMSFAQFKAEAATRLPEIAKYRFRTIYKTNMQSAWNTGRWQAFEESKKDFPFLQYVAVMDQNTRDEHAALDGQIYHVDDPFWDVWAPPNGYNCRCRLRALTAAQAGRAGENEELPDGIEPAPGFNHNPAKQAWSPDPTKFDPDVRALEAGILFSLSPNHHINRKVPNERS